MRRAEQRGRAVEDRLEQPLLVVAVEQGQRRLVERAQIRVAERAVDAVVIGLDEVQRPVGDRDQLVLRPAVVGVAGDADADRHARARLGGVARQWVGPFADGSPDPLGDLVGRHAVGTRQERRELVAAVAVQPVGVARGVGHRPGELDEQAVAGRVAERVVEPLEGVEVEHQHRERAGRASTAAPSSRWNAPWLRSPVSASCSARTRTSPCASAFCIAIEAWPANSLVSSNSLTVKWASAFPTRPMLSVPDGVAMDQQRDDDDRLRLERRARHLDRPRIEVRLVGEDGFGVIDDPAGDADPQRALVGEDLVGEAVARDDRAADAGRPVDLVDRQRVVGHDGLERVGDEVQDAGRIERRRGAAR